MITSINCGRVLVIKTLYAVGFLTKNILPLAPPAISINKYNASKLWYFFNHTLRPRNYITWKAKPRHSNNRDAPEYFFGGNLIVYLFFISAFVYLRRNQAGRNNNLERSILELNNELQRMRIENEWRVDAISQGNWLNFQDLIELFTL